MAVDDVVMCPSKPEAASECCDTKSSRNSAEIEPSGSSSRASSLLTDITECSSSSTTSSSSSNASASVVNNRLPSTQFQQPSLRSKHLLYKSTSSFHLSGGGGCGGRYGHHALYNGGGSGVVQACCQLARFPPQHPSFANFQPLSTYRHLRQMQAQHHCSQTPYSKGPHHQFQSGQQQQQYQQQQQQQAVIPSSASPSPPPQQQCQGAVQQFGRQSSFNSYASGCASQVTCYARNNGNGGGACGCCPCCCHCDQRFIRRQSLTSNNFEGSFEGLMGSPSHTVEGLPAPEPGPPPLTAEGLSWRRLHMSRAKLKATATTSELLSGFAMVAMVELQINEPTNVPEWLLVLFAVCTTVLVSVHIFALMISTYILPNVDAVSKMQHNGDPNDHCSHNRNPSYSSSTTFSSAGIDPTVLESPHERMRGFIELAWAFSTVLGLFLFLVELAILCWVKFWDHSFTAALAATVIVIPVLVLFLFFAGHFYRSLVAIKCDTSASDMRDLERMKADLDAAARDATAASNV